MNWLQKVAIWLIFRDLVPRKDLRALLAGKAHIHRNPERKRAAVEQGTNDQSR